MCPGTIVHSAPLTLTKAPTIRFQPARATLLPCGEAHSTPRSRVNQTSRGGEHSGPPRLESGSEGPTFTFFSMASVYRSEALKVKRLLLSQESPVRSCQLLNYFTIIKNYSMSRKNNCSHRCITQSIKPSTSASNPFVFAFVFVRFTLTVPLPGCCPPAGWAPLGGIEGTPGLHPDQTSRGFEGEILKPQGKVAFGRQK